MMAMHLKVFHGRMAVWIHENNNNVLKFNWLISRHNLELRSVGRDYLARMLAASEGRGRCIMETSTIIQPNNVYGTTTNGGVGGRSNYYSISATIIARIESESCSKNKKFVQQHWIGHRDIDHFVLALRGPRFEICCDEHRRYIYYISRCNLIWRRYFLCV